VCDPLDTVVVLKLNESDVELVLLGGATTLPSIKICILVTPTLSEAVALTTTVPEHGLRHWLAR